MVLKIQLYRNVTRCWLQNLSELGINSIESRTLVSDRQKSHPTVSWRRQAVVNTTESMLTAHVRPDHVTKTLTDAGLGPCSQYSPQRSLQSDSERRQNMDLFCTQSVPCDYRIRQPSLCVSGVVVEVEAGIRNYITWSDNDLQYSRNDCMPVNGVWPTFDERTVWVELGQMCESTMRI